MPSRAGRPSKEEKDQRQWATLTLKMPREVYEEIRETIALAKRVGVDIGNDIEALRSVCAEFSATYLAIHASQPPRNQHQAIVRAAHERDGWACLVCGRHDQLTPHHITARSARGKDTLANLATLCLSCHEDIQPKWKAWRPLLLQKIHQAQAVEEEAQAWGAEQVGAAIPDDVA